MSREQQNLNAAKGEIKGQQNGYYHVSEMTEKSLQFIKKFKIYTQSLTRIHV